MEIRFVGVIGDQGSGKTNFVTDQLYRASLNDTPIVANFHLEFPFSLMPFSDLATLPEALAGAMVGMDELGIGADSYEFMEGQARGMGRLVTQLRKRDCVAYYTVQRFNLIAKRLREQTNIFVLMEDQDVQIKHGDPSQPETTDNYHCKGQFNVTFLNAKFQPIREMVFNGLPTRHLYNTREIIW